MVMHPVHDLCIKTMQLWGSGCTAINLPSLPEKVKTGRRRRTVEAVLGAAPSLQNTSSRCGGDEKAQVEALDHRRHIR
jgi:hypothetical protein